MLTVWVGLPALLTFSLPCIGQSTERPPRPAHSIDIHNGTALQEYTASLRRLLVQSGGGRSMPGMSRNSLAGRLRNPFEGVGLGSRQTCTCSTCTDNKNYCFPADTGSYCSNCGVCCVADKSYCCNFQTAVCCPGDTDGCCEEWQTCDTGVGCKDPTCVFLLLYLTHNDYPEAKNGVVQPSRQPLPLGLRAMAPRQCTLPIA